MHVVYQGAMKVRATKGNKFDSYNVDIWISYSSIFNVVKML